MIYLKITSFLLTTRHSNCDHHNYTENPKWRYTSSRKRDAIPNKRVKVEGFYFSWNDEIQWMRENESKLITTLCGSPKHIHNTKTYASKKGVRKGKATGYIRWWRWDNFVHIINPKIYPVINYTAFLLTTWATY